MEGSCEYSRGQPISGGFPVWGLGKGPTTSHRKRNSSLQKVKLGFGIGQI